MHVHSSRFPHLISAFCSLFKLDDSGTKLAECTRQLEFSYADPLILLLIKEALHSSNNGLVYYSALIEQYFRSEVAKDIEKRGASARGVSLKELEIAAAKIAYGLLTKNPEWDLAGIISEGIEGAKLKETVSSLLPDAIDANYAFCVRALLTAYSTVTRHSVIRNVYAAKHVISTYETSPPDDEARRQHFRLLNHVYPNYINKCFKHLISTPGKAKGVLDGAFQIALDRELSPLLREHAVYLIGRFAPLANYKDKALKILREVYEVETSFDNRFATQIAKSSEEELYRRQYRLLVRGTCIGRSYCDDTTAAFEYIKTLIEDQDEDNFNRGFIIEYFGDMVYQPEVGFSLRDKPNLPFKNTFYELLRRVSNGIASGAEGICDPIWSVDVCTFVSIIRVRHARGLLAGSLRTAAIDILDKVIGAFEVHGGLLQLREYCCMVRRNLTCLQFHPIDVLRSLYALKTEVRAGWKEKVKRGAIKDRLRIESVADHSFFCHMIAKVLLPPWNEKLGARYEKQMVKSMLLYHDLAEAYIGDHAPGEVYNTDNELDWFRYLNMVGTYDGIFGVSEISGLYQKYHEQTTPEAKIARDINSIETLCQLYLYGSDIVREEFLSLESLLLSKVRTEPGSVILQRVQAWRNSEPISEDFAHYNRFV